MLLLTWCPVCEVIQLYCCNLNPFLHVSCKRCLQKWTPNLFSLPWPCLRVGSAHNDSGLSHVIGSGQWDKSRCYISRGLEVIWKMGAAFGSPEPPLYGWAWASCWEMRGMCPNCPCWHQASQQVCAEVSLITRDQLSWPRAEMTHQVIKPWEINVGVLNQFLGGLLSSKG